MTAFAGPIISTVDLDVWEHLLTNGFSMQRVASQHLDSKEVERLWGFGGHSADTAIYQTDGLSDQIRVVKFSPGVQTTIRTPASGYDCNALKVIDYYTADFGAAVKRLDAAGFKLKDDIAHYDLPNAKGITEGHLWGPDDVVCALIAGPVGFLGEFVTRTNALHSEVMSVSAPVESPEVVAEFYRDIGLFEVYRYEINDASFQELVGANKKLHIRAVNFGTRREDPYLGIIHYGLPKRTYKSLAAESVMPNRGLAGATILAADLPAIAEVCARRGDEIVAEMGPVTLAPWGRCLSFSVRAPHSVLHHFVQPLD